jgi:HEPN domain-containing protein/predicted nucleotidyltransferase
MASAKTRFKAWIDQAHYDLDAANDSIIDGNYEWACYQAVQAVEKSLKAVIKHAGWQPPKTHKLGILVGIANKANKLFFEVKIDFRKVEAFATIARYPFIVPGENNAPHEFISKDDASSCFIMAQEIVKKITDFIGLNTIEKGEGSISLNGYYYTDSEIDKRLADIVNNLLSSDLKLEKVILFGSFARTKSSPRASTMDILVVAGTELSFIERIQYVRELTKGGEPIIEPLVYTPSEFSYMLEEEGEGFLENAIKEGKTIYDSSVSAKSVD